MAKYPPYPQVDGEYATTNGHTRCTLRQTYHGKHITATSKPSTTRSGARVSAAKALEHKRKAVDRARITAAKREAKRQGHN